VVGADASGRVRLQGRAEHLGGVAVDVTRAVEGELRELAIVAGDHAREVHHLGEPDHPPAAEEPFEIPGRERPPRRLEVGGRDARGSHEEDLERKRRADVEEPVDAVGAEDVGDLVWIRDDRRCPERQDKPRELVDEELRRLEVHVCVDESGDDVPFGRVDDSGRLIAPEACHEPVADREVDLEPLAREDREDAPAADHEVGALVAPGNGDSAGETRHGATILLDDRSDRPGGVVAPARSRSRPVDVTPRGRRGYSSLSPYWAALLRSSRQWTSWVLGCRHSRIRYSKPGRSTIGIGSGDAGPIAPTTIFASVGMNGDCAGIGAVTISTGSP
jgi:hypothetical protein